MPVDLKSHPPPLGRGYTICFLSSMHPPRDKRVFDKEAVSLAQAGYSVIHLAPDNGPSFVEQGVKVVTYRRPRGIVGRLTQAPRLFRRASRLNADCYHCNEVDSWIIGVLLKLSRGKQVVFDVHEHYPSTFAESRFPPFLRPTVANLIRLVFRSFTPFTNRLVFAKRSVAADFPGTEKKQVLVQNFTPLAARSPINEGEKAAPKAEKAAGQPITAIHLGLISRVRGWPQLLDAVGQMQHDNLHLLIVGTFNDNTKADFDAQASELKLTERIRTLEWVPFSEAYALICSADIGLVLFQPGIQNHVFALPHKMFDYMMAGLPVIAPDFAEEVSAIIKEADCGILVDPSKPDEIAAALERLASDPEERARLGRNGQQAVATLYNWEAEAAKLVTMYQELEGLKRNKSFNILKPAKP